MDTSRVRLMPFLVAMLAAVAAMPTNVYQVCAWGAGTLEIEPWRQRAGAALRSMASAFRSWFAALWTPRVAWGCLALILLLVLASQLSTEHGVLLATAPVVATLRSNRAGLLREAEGLRAADGTFADDAARTAFDAKMAQIDALDAQIRVAEATPPAPAPAAQPSPADVERARIMGIQSAVRTARLPETFATDLVTRNVAIDEARSAIFAEMARTSDANRTDPHIGMGEDASDKFVRGATNWLLIKGGAVRDVARAMKAEVSSFDPGEFRGMTLVDLARTAIERAGRHARGLDKMRLVSDAFTLRSATQSTSDFTTLLENVMHKILQSAYAIQPDTWTRFANQGTVSDFRAHNRYRMGNFSSLDALGEDGEFKNKSILDGEKATITALTKGNIVSVSRQMIVNDDMGVFTRLLTLLGRAAKLSVEVDVYALLAQNAGLGPTLSDGLTLFHATHGNIGTGAALSAAAIDADRVVMASQKEPNGIDYIDLRPAVLLLPVGLGGQARVINQSQYDPDTIANKSQMKPNIVVGLFRDIVDTPRITGTRRYLFADASIAPVIEVAFLEGQTEPVLETKDGWRVDGAEMKVRYDYGVAGVDYRGAATNAGV